VASDTSIRIGFCVYLTYEDYEAETIDITAAFLEGTIIRVPTFIEWPGGMLELGFVLQKDIEENCIQLLKLMYGNVDAAIQFFRTYQKHLMEQMHMKQSLADPGVFYKKDDSGQTTLIAMCFVDNTLLFGLKKEIEWYKTNVKKRFDYKDLGEFRKHLGVWYKLKYNKEGNRYLVAMMPK
jgi:hypothetical protein